MIIRNNKGNVVFTTMEYLITSLVVGFVLIFCFIIVTNFNDGIQNNNSTRITTEIKVISETQEESFKDFDFIFPVLTIGIFALTVIIARMDAIVHPIWLFVGILALIAIPFFGGFIIGNVWFGFTQETMISTALLNFPFLTFLMDNIVITTILYIATAIIVRHTSKKKGDITL